MDAYSIKIMLRKSLILVVLCGTKGQGPILKWVGAAFAQERKNKENKVSVEKSYRLLELDGPLKGKQQLWCTHKGECVSIF